MLAHRTMIDLDHLLDLGTQRKAWSLVKGIQDTALNPQFPLLPLVHTLRCAGILLEKSEVAPLSRARLVRREINHIDTRFGRSAHGWVFEAEQRPQWLDHKSGHIDEHLRRVGPQRARIGQIAGVDGNGRNLAQVRIL